MAVVPAPAGRAWRGRGRLVADHRRLTCPRPWSCSSRGGRPSRWRHPDFSSHRKDPDLDLLGHGDVGGCSRDATAREGCDERVRPAGVEIGADDRVVSVGGQEIAHDHAADRARSSQNNEAAAQYQRSGASLKLMWTCLTCRYSSAPQGPSSRPIPDIL